MVCTGRTHPGQRRDRTALGPFSVPGPRESGPNQPGLVLRWVGVNGEITPLPVLRIRNFLMGTYAQHINMDDVAKRTKPADREDLLLSRCLAALAIADTLGLEPAEAAERVTDGGEDWGIDSLGVDGSEEETPTLLLNQSKWSDKVSGKFGRGDVHTLRQGITYLINGDYSKFNRRVQEHAESVRRIFVEPRSTVILMITVMRRREQKLDATIMRLLTELQDEVGGPESVDLRVRYFEDIEEMYERAWSGSSINLKPRLESFVRHDGGPQRAYYGTISAKELSSWFGSYGIRLFDDNVRLPLGRTTVNSKIVHTLMDAPLDFFYQNNGVAVLCDTVREAPGALMNSGGVLELKGARVVNGAQTIESIARAMEEGPDQASQATVGIKVICLEGSPAGFGDTVTRAMNTQNAMVLQDYVALDKKQKRLAADFRERLNKAYVLQRGSELPAPDEGCFVEEAAEALACAVEDAGVTARVRKDPEALWDTEAEGLYHRLFGGELKAEAVWKQVSLLRAVRARLDRERADRAGKAALIAEHGGLLCAHIVLRRLRDAWVSDESFGPEWLRLLEEADELTGRVLDLVVYHHGERYSFPVATLKNPQRSRELAAFVSADLNGTEPVVLREEDQPRKRSENAVTVLHRSARIPDGTSLELSGGTSDEVQVLSPWLAEDPRRGRATWVARGGRQCVRWEVDGRRYSATGLVKHILDQAYGAAVSGSLQGTKYWFVPGEGSLVELAEEVRRAEEE